MAGPPTRLWPSVFDPIVPPSTRRGEGQRRSMNGNARRARIRRGGGEGGGVKHGVGRLSSHTRLGGDGTPARKMRRWEETRRQLREPGLKMDSKAVRLPEKEAWRWRNEAVAGKQQPGGHIDKSAAAVLRSCPGSVGIRSRLLQGLCSSPESQRSDLPAASAEVNEEDGSSSGHESAEAGA